MNPEFKPRTPISKKGVLIVLVLLLAMGGAYSLGKGHSAGGSGVGGVAAASAAAPAGIPVDAYKLTKEDVSIYMDTSARVRALRTSEVRPQVDGVIVKRFFEEGSTVQKGDQLYLIDPAPYQATYDSAVANLERAVADKGAIEAKAMRFEALMDVDAVSAQEYDDVMANLAKAEAEVSVAKAAVASAKVNLDYTKVYAPIDGVIGQSSVTEGALVSKGQSSELATISQMDTVYVDMVATQDDVYKIKQQLADGKKLEVELFLGGSGDAYEVKGYVDSSAVVIDETTDTLQVRAIFANEKGLLLPGMYVRARTRLDTLTGVLVPQRAAVRVPGGALTIWKVGAENKVEVVPVMAQRTVGDKWLVTSGANEGDVIVLKGFQRIKPGAVVSYSMAEEK